jgi:hypothetical protein
MYTCVYGWLHAWQVIFGHGPTLRKEAEAKAVQTFLKLTYKGWCARLHACRQSCNA